MSGGEVRQTHARMPAAPLRLLRYTVTHRGLGIVPDLKEVLRKCYFVLAIIIILDISGQDHSHVLSQPLLFLLRLHAS